MSQNSLILPNGTGAAFRSDANDALDTLLTLNSGSSAPSPTSAYMLWADSGSGKLKIRNAANSAWVEIGTMATTYLGLANLAQANAWLARQDFAKGSNVASSSSITWGGGGNFIHITGTTTITSFGALQAGTLMVVEFEGALTLTHNGTDIILDGARNAITQAGDVFVFVSEGTGMREVCRSRRDIQVDGAGRFQYQSATECRFIAYKGNKIMINGSWETIPSGTTGVSFPNTGLTGGPFLRYAYVYMSGGTMTGEWSSTGHSTDATTGQEIKTGDATRTLVGMAYVNSSNQFDDSADLRHVASWFNTRLRTAHKVMTGGNVTTSSGSNVEISSTARASFLVWSGRTAHATVAASLDSATGASVAYQLAMSVDGTAGNDADAVVQPNAGSSTTSRDFCQLNYPFPSLSEGKHYVTPTYSATALITAINNSVYAHVQVEI